MTNPFTVVAFSLFLPGQLQSYPIRPEFETRTVKVHSWCRLDSTLYPGYCEWLFYVLRVQFSWVEWRSVLPAALVLVVGVLSSFCSGYWLLKFCCTATSVWRSWEIIEARWFFGDFSLVAWSCSAVAWCVTLCCCCPTHFGGRRRYLMNVFMLVVIVVLSVTHEFLRACGDCCIVGVSWMFAWLQCRWCLMSDCVKVDCLCHGCLMNDCLFEWLLCRC